MFCRSFEEKVKSKNKIYCELIFGSSDLFVLNGPFRGLKYTSKASCSALLPKLVGSYEEPIHSWLEEIISSHRYSAMVDVGCAEGFYAVGLASVIPAARIYAYDINETALRQAEKLALLNNVPRQIVFSTLFNHVELNKILSLESGKILLFVDIEGAELNLLNPASNPSVLNVDLLVELRDCFVPGLTQKITEYFVDTHQLSIVYDCPWRSRGYELTKAGSSVAHDSYIFDEMRSPRMSWLYAMKKP